MEITAKVSSSINRHDVVVTTNDSAKHISLPVKAGGVGSAINGGELLMLALATCYCNDLYREAAKQQIEIKDIEVQCISEFGAEGEPGRNIRYQVKIAADAPGEDIDALIQSTDRLAEVHNTLRKGTEVILIR